MVRQPLCRGEIASANADPGRIQRFCHRQRHRALVIVRGLGSLPVICPPWPGRDRCRPHDPVCRSEEHTSELQSLMRISYAVFFLKKKNNTKTTHIHLTNE